MRRPSLPNLDDARASLLPLYRPRQRSSATQEPTLLLSPSLLADPRRFVSYPLIRAGAMLAASQPLLAQAWARTAHRPMLWPRCCAEATP